MHDFVAIEGNIGAGKTTLATAIAAATGRRLLLEEFEENPFLPDFYRDGERYAFPLELYFLAERFQQLKELASGPDLFSEGYVSDYFIHKSLIFAKQNLNADEFKLFVRLFDQLHGSLPKPDIVLYLYRGVEELQANIRKRGREYEQSIEDDYLDGIQKEYLSYLERSENMTILLWDCEGYEFTSDSDGLRHVLSALDKDYPKGVNRIEF